MFEIICLDLHFYFLNILYPSSESFYLLTIKYISNISLFLSFFLIKEKLTCGLHNLFQIYAFYTSVVWDIVFLILYNFVGNIEIMKYSFSFLKNNKETIHNIYFYSKVPCFNKK